MTERSLNITVVLKQKNYVRVFAPTLRELALRRHHVRVLWQEPDLELPSELQGFANIVVGSAPKRRRDAWGAHASLIRRAADYLQFLNGPYRGATKLRARAFDKMLHSLAARMPASPGWSDGPLVLDEASRGRLHDLFRRLESSIPNDPSIEALLAQNRPDVLLVSPLIDLGSSQTDFVKSAKALGIPVGALVFSWDNLSTKGTLHEWPDRLFVWNERQRREAVELHGYPANQVVVTGSPRFDAFFEQRARLTREEFCAPLEFDPGRPTLMYVGSSRFVSDRENAFIGRWIARVRASSEPLSGCNILVRPHPDLPLSEAEGPAVTFQWPGVPRKAWLTRPFSDGRTAVVRTSYSSPEGFFECLHHSAAVVGLNTSAEIEAGVAGRPVLTVKADEDLVDGQESTLHFHYLLEENGGFVRRAASLDEHVEQLAATLTQTDRSGEASRIQAFVLGFVRPGGPDRKAFYVLADAIEAFAENADSVSSTDAVRVVNMDYKAADIRLAVTSRMEDRYRAHACAKEPWTVQWLESSIKAGDVLYDIGANVGAFTLIAARHLGATVVAFEPGYANYARLCENVVLNHCDGAVIPLPVALADTTGLLGFQYRGLEPGQSRHALDTQVWRPRDSTRSRYVQPICALRLDEAISRFQLPCPNHMKIDVDGAELRVLAGASAALEHTGLRSILAEVGNELLADVTGLLKRAGFRLSTRLGREERPGTYALYER